ncbi:alpha,alpha-trehalase TreF [Halomonas sp. HP20-15]|uniref:alpha,alpha-trehalase TreF n=1 Tax=Halomonas sp. HP20-15 TaxID=3085901 RepID=UPI0029829EDB|nr:alpha,alpha-trehalase TreF [Halomonas sp. HP20-15]MDW5375570.1 alpha,alpha-trehalase TreF [Halomonas sp. HP20-15]
MDDLDMSDLDPGTRVSQIEPADPLTPADRYAELFVDVQCSRVFDDSKTFVDCIPRQDPEAILRAYRARKDMPGFDLAAFVDEYFIPEREPFSNYASPPNQSLVVHIDGLWDVLTRHPQQHPRYSSLLPLPYAYVVPGGRFREMYYWDSHFTMLGLAESGRPHLMRAMAGNFAYLIDTYGHVPNGNRSYYLSRSQPPVFALMVDLFTRYGVIRRSLDYLPQLRREYAYWMAGAETLRPGEAHRCCVRLGDGTLLNRYWDDRDTPREEAYLEDVTTAQQSTRPDREVYRDLRAGAASGWDFSSRWLDDAQQLSSIRTTALLPVDLNSFMYKLEAQIARLSALDGDIETAKRFQDKADERSRAIRRVLWNERVGAFFDYDWQRDRLCTSLNAATVTPLYVELATREQARRVAQVVRRRLLSAGGIATTEIDSDQQWDHPNGWAPLQWLAMRGFTLYGETALAQDISDRWLATVGRLYERKNKLIEKYVLTPLQAGKVGGGGGEYPLQDGFGWTNGVTRRLLRDSPRRSVDQSRVQKP